MFVDLFISFLAGFMIGGLMGAALIYTYELKVIRDFRKRVEDVESKYLAMIGVGQEQREEN